MQKMGNLENLISESYKFIGMADDLHDVASYINEIRICFIMLTMTAYFLLAIFLIRTCIRKTQRQVNTRSGVESTCWNSQRKHFQHNNRTSPWDYQGEDYHNSNKQGHTTHVDDLVSVQSDGQTGNENAKTNCAISAKPNSYSMGRSHRSQPPSFMRHGFHSTHQNSNFNNNVNPLLTNINARSINTNKTDNNLKTVNTANSDHHQHQIPHIVTTEISTNFCQNDSGGENASPMSSREQLFNLRHHYDASTKKPNPAISEISATDI